VSQNLTAEKGWRYHGDDVILWQIASQARTRPQVVPERCVDSLKESFAQEVRSVPLQYKPPTLEPPLDG